MLLALLTAAHAYTPAGFAILEPMGGLSGTAEPGVLGLAWQPAAAAPESAEAAIDLGAVYLAIDHALAAAPEQRIQDAGTSLVPAMGLAVPVGPVGFGFSFFPLYARGGNPLDDQGPQRFHTISGDLQVLVGEPAIAWRITESLTAGACLRVGLASLNSHKAIDSGAIINDVAGEGTVALGDPFLEGTQTLTEHSGRGYSAGAGVRFAPRERTSVDLAVRAPMPVTLRGPVSLVPSNDLNLQLAADVETTLVFPPSVFLAGQLPVGSGSVVLEVNWIGWSSAYAYDSTLSDSEISSEDPIFQTLLEGYGVTELELLGSEASTTTTGMRNTINPGASLRWPVGPVELRGGVWSMPNAVTDAYMHPSNVDFHTFDFRLAALWAPLPWLTLGAAGDVVYGPQRDISGTIYGLDDPNDTGMLVPSGDGEYNVAVARAGLTVLLRRPSEPAGD